MVIMNNVNTTERLIQEVRSRPPLWDQRNLNYHNRVVVNALWQDIADLLQVNKETVKVKWKGLRDTYRRELKKQRTSGGIQSCSENARDPSWTHYSSMNFLREYMGSNHNQNDQFQFQGWPADDLATADEAVSPGDEVFGSFMSAASIAEVVTYSATVAADSAASVSGDETVVKSDHHQKTELQLPPENDDSATADSPAPKKRCISRLSRLKEHRLRSRLARKHTKLQNGTAGSPAAPPEDSDDDLYFFKSLIPYVRSLPPTRKLYLRSEIHNLVLREIMTDSSGSGGGCGSHGVIPLEHVSVGLNA